MKPRLLLSLLAASLILHPALAEDQNPANTNANPAVAPKFFIWGILISAIESQVFSMFTEWLMNKLTDGLALSIPLPKGSSVHLVPSVEAKGITPPETVSGKPDAPLKIGSKGENYQGVHIAIAVLDADNRTLKMRPVDQGYRSGEKFKLRVISTFEGDMKVENINPHGEKNQIYPADPGMRIRIEAGKETLIPAGKDEFFEFTKATGEEQLVITLRDPRGRENTVSHYKVYRQDETYGSNFVQEVSPGQYPVISESIRLAHF